MKNEIRFERLSSGCYQSKDGRIEINKLPCGSWAWAIDGIGYDAEPTLNQARDVARKCVIAWSKTNV